MAGASDFLDWLESQDLKTPLGKAGDYVADRAANLNPHLSIGDILSQIDSFKRRAAQSTRDIVDDPIEFLRQATALQMGPSKEAQADPNALLASPGGSVDPSSFGMGGITKGVQSVARSKGALTKAFPDDPDIVRSLLSGGKNAPSRISNEVIDTARGNRAELRAEPNVLPKPAAQMTADDWKWWGEQHGVDMTVTPSQTVFKDVFEDLKLPGGTEGKFTIPDLFQIKSENFDPSVLPQNLHNLVMQKFMRTYDRPGGMDAVDKYNALNFAQLSPNAPLTPNEFLAARFRARNPEELSAVADQAGETFGEKGTGAASRGGLGVKGTANLDNLPKLAYLLREAPEMFNLHPGETMIDLARRVMNQVPGLGQKTASLGTPWLDLAHADTSAVDLHMIRHGFHQLMEDPQLGEAFTERLATKLKKPGASVIDLVEQEAADPKFAAKLEKAAIQVIGADKTTSVYRAKKTGELPANLDPSLAPEKLAYEPDKVQDFGPFYKKIVSYIDASRGENPVLPLFPEQWRLWDTYRGRIEPHEIMHPDFRKLPRMSFEELQQALGAHREAGYLSDKPISTGEKVPWGRLYYGKADPELLAALAAAGIIGTGAAASAGQGK